MGGLKNYVSPRLSKRPVAFRRRSAQDGTVVIAVPRPSIFPNLRISIVALLLLAAGCTHHPPAHVRQGPATVAPISIEHWEYEGQAGKKLITPHYIICSTINDEQVLAGGGPGVARGVLEY